MDSPQGRIPKELEVKKLAEVFEIQLGKMLSKAAKTGVNPKPYLGNKNVQWERVDTREFETIENMNGIFTTSPCSYFIRNPKHHLLGSSNLLLIRD
jgi:hypothetical protein